MFRFLALALAFATLQAAELPRKAPEFAINLLGGKKVELSSCQGKVVALAFILTTCSHCQNTTRILMRAQKDFGARGFQVLESTVEVGGEGMLPRFIDQFSPPFPVGFNAFNDAQTFMQHSAMLIMHMPGLLFLDRQGRIVAQYEGDDPFMSEDQQEANIRAKIEQMLKGPAAGSRTTAHK
jgi:cytochrome oxidase Cu insertion factor (SCO1/SenC/PrrC family)